MYEDEASSISSISRSQMHLIDATHFRQGRVVNNGVGQTTRAPIRWRALVLWRMQHTVGEHSCTRQTGVGRVQAVPLIMHSFVVVRSIIASIDATQDNAMGAVQHCGTCGYLKVARYAPHRHPQPASGPCQEENGQKSLSWIAKPWPNFLSCDLSWLAATVSVCGCLRSATCVQVHVRLLCLRNFLTTKTPR